MSTSGTTTSTVPTDPSPPQHPCEPGTSPLDLTGSNASRYSEGTVSVESSTSTGMPLDLCGRNFRHAQGISAVYELPIVETGTDTIYSRKLERWIEQARKTVNPRTGLPYLLGYDNERDAPKRWPGSDGRSAL